MFQGNGDEVTEAAVKLQMSVCKQTSHVEMHCVIQPHIQREE